MSTLRPGQRVVRFYPEVRSAHLERLDIVGGSTTYYLTRRSDFDSTVVRGADFRQVSMPGLIRALWRSPATHLEMPEPMWFQYFPHSSAVIASVRIRDLFSKRRTQVVAYAIENSHIERRPRPLKRLPVWAWAVPARHALRVHLKGFDRIAFGTSGAREALIDALGESSRSADRLRRRSRVILAIPTTCNCAAGRRVPAGVLFVGALEERKGVSILTAAWDLFHQLEPDATLTIVGEGPLQEAVRSAAARVPSIIYLGPQDRASIHALYRRASVVVLPSQPHNRWREQVGLPLTEALAHGCRVVTTNETGLASWLGEQGAEVLDAPTSPSALANAIASALREPSSPEYLLPNEDGRIVADRWLLDSDSIEAPQA